MPTDAALALAPHTGRAPDPRQLLHLLHLASPTLPIGAYAYSQGIESAVHAGFIRDAAHTEDWVVGLLTHVLSRVDVPLLARHHAAWSAGDRRAVERWSAWLLAQRESRELQDEDISLGTRLAALLRDLGCAEAADLAQSERRPTLASAFALAAVHWAIPLEDAASGYLFAWLEGQIAAATRLIPLGQTEAQRALLAALTRVPEAVEVGLGLDDGAIGASAPGLGILSALHETQYTRLFRS